MAAWHFWLTLPFGCCAGNPVHWIVTARSLYQIFSSVLTRIAQGTLCHNTQRGQGPSCRSQVHSSGLSIVEIPEGMAAGRAVWEGGDWTRLSQREHCHNWIWHGNESLWKKKKSEDLDVTFSTFSQCFGNALKIYTWTASTMELLAHSSDAPELQAPWKRALSKQWLALLRT